MQLHSFVFEASLNASPTGEGDQPTSIHVIIMAPTTASSSAEPVTSPRLLRSSVTQQMAKATLCERASLDGVHSGTGEGVCQTSSTGTHDRKIPNIKAMACFDMAMGITNLGPVTNVLQFFSCSKREIGGSN